MHNTLTLDINIGFAHTASYDRTTNQIYFHGGLTINSRLSTTNNKSTQAPFTFKSVDELSRDFKAYLFDINNQKESNERTNAASGTTHLSFDPAPHMSNMLYKYDLNQQTWSQLPASSHSTYMHSSLLYKSSLLMFGGVVASGSSDQPSHVTISDSLRIFNTQNNEWLSSQLSFKNRHRYAHSSFVHQDSLFIFAGFNGFFLQDLFKIDLVPLGLDKLANSTHTLKQNSSRQLDIDRKKVISFDI